MKHHLIGLLALSSLSSHAIESSWDMAKSLWSENVESVSIKSNMPSVTTDYSLEINGQERDVSFQTYANGSYTYAIATKLFDFGITFPNSGDEKVQTTKYSDFYFKTQIGDFELTYHQAEFLGGNVNEGPLTEEDAFYEDYQIDKKHFRLSYYFNTQYNKILDRPLKARSARAETSKNYFSSYIATIGYDDSQTSFPNLSGAQGAKVFNLTASEFRNSDYIQNLDTQTAYYSIGYAGLHMLSTNFTYDFK